jgi:hypothetical protein
MKQERPARKKNEIGACLFEKDLRYWFSMMKQERLAHHK